MALATINAHGAHLLDQMPGGPADGQILQIKITLRHVRPPCWRRIQLPGSVTLGDLHQVIQVAFEWDDDHLHAFAVSRRQYGDPAIDAEHDEDDITVAEAFRNSTKPLTYTYDFGDDWKHDIALEQTTNSDPHATYPVCVAGKGEAPVEDSDDEWVTFDQAGINERLAHLGEDAQFTRRLLRDDIDTILTDAYGEAEQHTAFLTVLEEEITFPVPATMLDTPSS